MSHHETLKMQDEIRRLQSQLAEQAAAKTAAWKGAEGEHLRSLQSQLEQANARIASLEQQVQVGLHIAGTFFEALKPLHLAAINVADPGQHVTDLIAERDAALEKCKVLQEQLDAK